MLVALGSIVLLATLAISVDMGMLLTARGESQRTADGAALAGAGSLVFFPNDAAAARAEATKFAAHNRVRGTPVALQPSDVNVDLGAGTVEVWVHHTQTRGNAIPTVFARLLGFDEVDVVTRAKAEVAVASSANCLLPVALPDRWNDDGDEFWDPPNDTYVPWPQPGHTGYTDEDVGLQIQIKTQPASGSGPPGCQTASTFDPCNSHPGWFCWWLDNHPSQGGGGGVSALAPRIHPGCIDPTVFSSVADDIWAASGAGNKQSLVQNEFVELVDSDPAAFWDDTNACVARPGEGCVTSSSRIRALPLIRPDQVSGGGANVTAPIHSFAGVFVEKVSCSPTMPHRGGPAGRWNVYVRFMGFTGFNPGAPAGPGASPLAKALRLIE